jgi:hypothetical protein
VEADEEADAESARQVVTCDVFAKCAFDRLDLISGVCCMLRNDSMHFAMLDLDKLHPK